MDPRIMEGESKKYVCPRVVPLSGGGWAIFDASYKLFGIAMEPEELVYQLARCPAPGQRPKLEISLEDLGL